MVRFGYETFLELPQGLHVWGLDQAFAFLAQHRFNAIRLPFSLEWALTDWDAPPEHQYNLPPDLRGLSTADVFHRLLDAAARHGVLVLLDLHVLSAQRGLEGLWYDGVNTEERVLQGWEKVLGAACKHWNVFGVDLKVRETRGPQALALSGM
jgi:endoglucanase